VRFPILSHPQAAAGHLDAAAGTISLFHAIQNDIVILMASDPEPPEVVFSPERNGPVRPTNINGPDFSFGLKSQGWVIGISLEKLVLFGGQVLHLLGEFCEELPKA